MEARGLWGRRVGVAWKEGNDEDDDLLKRDEGCDVRKEEVMVEEAMLWYCFFFQFWFQL